MAIPFISLPKYLPQAGVHRGVAVFAAIIAGLVTFHQVSYAIDVGAARFSHEIHALRTCDAREHSTIPNTVHQIWKTANISTYGSNSHEAWKDAVLPLNYTVKLWTEADILHLVRGEYPDLMPIYEGYQYNIQRADIARLLVIHARGGIYADLDAYPSYTHVLACVQSQGMQAVFTPTGSTDGLSNHFFMAEKGAPFLMAAVEKAKSRAATSRRILAPYFKVFWSTGPMMVTAAYRDYVHSHVGDKLVAVLEAGFAHDVVSHAAGRSWHGLDGAVLNYVADNITGRIVVFAVVGVILAVATVYLLARWWKSHGAHTCRQRYRKLVY